MRFLIYSLPFALVLLTRCGSQFEPDPIDPRLPRYSEQGLNTAGALINKSPWRAGRGVRLLEGASEDWRSDLDSSRVYLMIEGQLSGGSPLVIVFHLNNTDGDLAGINPLRGRRFSLGGDHYATVQRSLVEADTALACRSRAGQLFIKFLRLVDGRDNGRYVMSGTFSFTVDTDSCTRYEVNSGRFDYRVEGY